MTQIPVSVVVVSRDRPAALTLCLTGIAQLQYDPFEIVVVADPAGIAAAGALPFAGSLKLVPFDRPNISAARNLGIAQAGGEVVAFIDDDAVPEPSWLQHLAAPFEVPGVAACGGFVRARNGISFQSRAREVDIFGRARPLDIDTSRSVVLTPPEGRAVKTEGTNMAFRHDVLRDIGGFDEAYHYYLDETDLNLRLARGGFRTAIAPLAEVHHGYAASRSRTLGRIPLDLHDIGASWAVFQRKHVPETARAEHWEAIQVEERERLLRHLVQGGLEPGDVRRLLRRLQEGYADGQLRPAGQDMAQSPRAEFNPFPAQRRRSRLLHGRIWARRRLRAEAKRAVSEGEIVTLILLSHTALFHRLRFCRGGYWLQGGGLFGRSDRNQKIFRFHGYAGRVRMERERVRAVRLL